VGADVLFLIDAATFAVAAMLITTLPSFAADRHAPAVRTKSEGLTEMLRVALRQPEIRLVAAANFASGLVPTVTQAFLVVAAHERFGGDAAVGFLYAGVGIGGTLGSLVAFRWTPARGWTRFAVFVAIVIELTATAGFSAATVAQAALLLLAVSAVAGSSIDTWGVTELQRRAPPGFMGRYNSLIFMSLYAGMLVGALWALAVASVLHWDVAVEVACAAMLVIVGLVWIAGGTSRSGIQPEVP
jgi:predicted MFS family arabinose efflux permease